MTIGNSAPEGCTDGASYFRDPLGLIGPGDADAKTKRAVYAAADEIIAHLALVNGTANQ